MARMENGIRIDNVKVLSLTGGSEEWPHLSLEISSKMNRLFELRQKVYPEIWNTPGARASDSAAINALIDREINILEERARGI